MVRLPSISPGNLPFKLPQSFDTGTFPNEGNRNEIKAACIPFTPLVFNPTDKFKQLFDAAGKAFNIDILGADAHYSYIACCCLILNKYYKADLDFGRPLFYEIPTANGINKYYRIIYDTDFMEILPTHRSIHINEEDIQLLVNNYDNLDLWMQMFPPQSWLIKGFSTITLFDVTVEMAASLFKEKLLALKTDNFKDVITGIFRSILNLPNIEAGFTLVDQKTEKLWPAVFGHHVLSLLTSRDSGSIDIKLLCPVSYKRLITDRKCLAVADMAIFVKDNPESYIAAVFTRADIKSFLLVPIVKNNTLLGILEIVSSQPAILNSLNAQKLDNELTFLADAVERLVTRFHMQAEAVIQEYYTSVHPSVKWKFLHEAEKYVYQQELGRSYQLNDIVLKNVYPLYGEVDIKGSGRQRNECIKNDLATQLAVVLNLLIGVEGMHKDISLIEKLLEELQISFNADTEEAIENYLVTNLHQRLSKLPDNTKDDGLKVYLQEAINVQGIFYKNRNNYERTVERINEKLFLILDKEQSLAQQIIPHYFDYFKTDGIEQLLYAGSSIVENQQFNEEKLSQLRLWQVKTICKMVISHYQLIPELIYPLEVTSLILANHTPMTLRFRMDEKRFDADGAYNIRFEIIKKRIDKALIKNTNERITQAGKLTVVYSSETEEQEYLDYISVAQQIGLLKKDLEKLYVEDLQDVSGLKALRVSINTST